MMIRYTSRVFVVRLAPIMWENPSTWMQRLMNLDSMSVAQTILKNATAAKKTSAQKRVCKILDA